MNDEPLLTLDQLATVLRIPAEMARLWEADGILPGEETAAADGPRYRQRAVVRTLRQHPDLMEQIKAAMAARKSPP